ncbi:hypothetical protein [Robertkochia solimangrovi]|uniref:hypothetical protein n=1 Tax=Robertkochia solimangrovi TaxID=2213046 RepID=UPI00117D1BA7|nr:hypothetical protein [Robertkochia solimangrovi]TRZ44457.1 hypothetical protein DMZ48_08115 [Robertkochia solimangrovi]
MMRSLFPLLILLVLSTNAFGQRKSDLIAQIDGLNKELDSTQTELYVSQRRLATAETKAENLDLQMKQLRETNEGLLKNLNNFISASTERTNNIGKTLETLQRKEAQLKEIRQNFSAHDSVSFAVLTDLKRTLGENSQITVENGAVTVVLTNEFLFGASVNKAVVQESAKTMIGKISEAAQKHQGLSISVEGLGPDDIAMNSQRAGAVAQVLKTDYEFDPAKLMAVAKASGPSTVFVRLHPDFNNFYLWLREHMKNGN